MRRLLFLLIFTSNSLYAKASDFEFHFREGNRYAKEFQNEKALGEYKQASEINPQSFEARLKYLKTNNSIGQDLRDHHADEKITESFFKKNVELAEKLAQDFPNRTESPFCLAIAYGNLALYSSAREKVKLSQNIEKNLKRSIELDPNYPYAYLGLGIFYREVSKISFLERFFADLFFGEIPHSTLEDAEKYFRLSIERDPKFIFTHYNYAITLQNAAKLDEAAKEYQIVLNLPATDSGDSFLKEISRKALLEIQSNYPSIIMNQQSATAAP
ncbi:MAG: Tetratricopeptide repeat [Bacteriovoracaceae bacterium]|nr:Tetratricopeptide repeat [Bacteriovoracaceae bacterium]